MANKKKADFSEKPTIQQIESTETYSKDFFTIVNHNGEFFIALGNQVVSKEKFDTREEAERYIELKPWELILNSTCVMWENLNKIKEQTNK